jgi:cyclopropane-fatty-acyl-phospholipid synthase
MATREQIDATYNYQDEIFRLSFGEMASITCAMYDGDFTKTLEQAQADKNTHILEGLDYRPGFRVLDIGCGWGSVLDAVRRSEGRGVGITLSSSQATACRRNGLDVYVMDWKDMSAGTFGPFDAVISLGAFEHFCSVEEHLTGRQDLIYRSFFRLCYELLPPGGRLYLQTMLWGVEPPKYSRISIHAPKNSREYILAVLEKYYPGSWLPNNVDQIGAAARPYFQMLSKKNGRLDYIQTLNEFDRKLRRLSVRKLYCAAKFVPSALWDRDFRYKLISAWRNYNRECFVQGIMDHERMIFERVAEPSGEH